MTRIGSLFSGAGGLDLAVERVTGGRTVWQVERESAHMTRARESHSYGSAGDYRIVVRPDAPTGDDYRRALIAWADEQG